MSDRDDRYLARAATRAEANPFFVAFALAAYRALMDLDEARLAAWLGCSGEDMARLALCRRPDGEGAMFGDEVRRIAGYVNGNVSRLAQLLRTVETAEVMGTSAAATLLAAQDRRPEGDDATAETPPGAAPPQTPEAGLSAEAEP